MVTSVTNPNINDSSTSRIDQPFIKSALVAVVTSVTNPNINDSSTSKKDQPFINSVLGAVVTVATNFVYEESVLTYC